MTTLALIAGMLPVAIGLGEGGEFYRPMAVAIIGGTITSTLLTLLVIPSFYDSIEIARERALAKLHERTQKWNVALAVVVTLLEAVAALLLLRLVWRAGRRAVRWGWRSTFGRPVLPA
jgi:HAE1 family hydrophobic/amphiphilic exporter-1